MSLPPLSPVTKWGHASRALKQIATSESADRIFRWVLLLSSALLILLPPFGTDTLRCTALAVIVNVAAYLSGAILPESRTAKGLAILSLLALSAAAHTIHPIAFPLFVAILLPALSLHGIPQFPLIGGACAILLQGAFLLFQPLDPKALLLSVSMLAVITVLSAIIAALVHRQSLAVAEAERRIPELQAEVVNARQDAGQALRIKHDLLANLSHEIRTPLNGVLGMTRLLMDTRLSPEQRDLTQTLERSTTALLDIMNEVIDFSALESGRVELDPKHFEFHRPYEDVVELLGPLAQGKGIELLTEFDPSIPLHLIGDARRIRQVLLNLAGNALKFTENGHILIRTSLEESLPSEIVVRTEVLDTGPGISQEDHGRIFQPFLQGKTTHAAQYGGAGLGLTISKRLVEMMHGDIGFKCGHGKGSRFWFTVRCRRHHDEQFFDSSALAGQRVLALARYGAAAGVAACQMRLWSIDAFAASQTDAALAELIRARQAGKPYDMVLLDGDAHGPNSSEAMLARVRSIGRIPSVGVLAFGKWEDNGERADDYFDAVVTKPMRPSQLCKALSTARFGPDLPAPHGDDACEFIAGGNLQRILLVEDNPINQKVALRMLEKLGYAVDVAANGRFALEMMNNGDPYAAVIMDCMMPEMDGFEATREIRERERGHHHIPIIALTAHALHAEKERCLKSGMDDYITKPVHLEVLRQTLDRWLAQPARARSQSTGQN
ncbi:MAG: response regulator [Acidobacteria bacterium]|nr:response regulator [Acidobacteriota bacterium]